MTVTYSTYALVTKAIENIDATLVQVDVEEYINEAEGIINAVMLSSGADVPTNGFIDSFNTSKHMLLRSAATVYAAIRAITFNPNAQASSTQANMMLKVLWIFWDHAIKLLSDSRVVMSLK